MIDRTEKLVLVLDTDDRSATEVTGWFKDRNWTVQYAGNYVEFDALLTGSVSLVILDLDLPDVDGIEVLRLLAVDNYEGAILIFSDTERRFLRAAERIGRDQHLHMLNSLRKPATNERLHRCLNQLDEMAPLRDDRIDSAVRFSEESFADALEIGQIGFHFQPIIELDKGSCIAVEVLARWQHPEYGMLRAEQFIQAVSEDSHHRLFGLLLHSVLAQYAIWHTAGARFLLSINLSVSTLNTQRLPAYIDQYVKKHGIPKHLLSFEVTEEQFADDDIVAMENLMRLGLKGYKVAIDDFGTEYASLQRLSRMPVNDLKLDGQIVRNAVLDNDALAIMESCVKLGHKLNLWVTAEGVETIEQLNLARDLGCNSVQGYYLAKPVASGELMVAVDRAEKLARA